VVVVVVVVVVLVLVVCMVLFGLDFPVVLRTMHKDRHSALVDVQQAGRVRHRRQAGFRQNPWPKHQTEGKNATPRNFNDLEFALPQQLQPYLW
jgi:hypothetical protein